MLATGPSASASCRAMRGIAVRRATTRARDTQVIIFLIRFFFALSMTLTSVMQGVNGLHFCRLVGRIQAEDHADNEAEYHRQGHHTAVESKDDTGAGHHRGHDL